MKSSLRNLSFINYHKNGFTLVELLIVITIIALLSAIGLVLYGQFTKSARDARRQSDLKLIQSALEDYHNDQLVYPSSLSFGSALSSGLKTYLTKIPNDPLSTQAYHYTATCSGGICTAYCLSAKLEGSDPADECTPFSGDNLGVTRP